MESMMPSVALNLVATACRITKKPTGITDGVVNGYEQLDAASSRLSALLARKGFAIEDRRRHSTAQHRRDADHLPYLAIRANSGGAADLKGRRPAEADEFRRLVKVPVRPERCPRRILAADLRCAGSTDKLLRCAVKPLPGEED
jgi:hypothetical protein